MTIAIIDYGMGNLQSVAGALSALGADAFIACDPGQLADVSHIILPGVGAFHEGMANLSSHGWIQPLLIAVREHHKPLLGICLGMQMLADIGEEGAMSDRAETGVAGLGLIPGRVRKLALLDCQERIPHAGWNSVDLAGPPSVLMQGVASGNDFYFVHSYAFVAEHVEHVVGSTDYGTRVTAVIERDNIFGTQFHPEKSSRAGGHVLQNFIRLT